ncbi:MAG: DUF4325 domain-containing protein [Rhodospirillales bacterium]|nr:DUF4325 domain-containing protein [Rhodospirillales bacterium]
MTQAPDAMPEIPVQGDVIGLVGPVRSKHIRKIAAAAQECAANFGAFCLDFSKVTEIRAPQALPLICLAARYRSSGADVRVVDPENSALLRTMSGNGWLHYFRMERPPPFRAKGAAKRLPTLGFLDGDEHFAVVQTVVEHVLSTVPDLSRDQFSAFEWALNEITDNVLNHARSAVGGLIHVSHFRGQQRLVEYIVCDSGVGIPETLRTALPGLKDDRAALQAAIEEGVTRDAATNAGNGLYGSYRISLVSGGHFEIESGFARLHYSSSNHVRKETGRSRGGMRIDRSPTVFPGTMVRASLNYRNTFALTEALAFSRPYAAPVDYIENRYEDESGIPVVPVKRDWRNFGSRRAGEMFRTRLENLIAMSARKRVVLDMSGIHVVSSSFADEVFGKLYAALGPSRFHDALLFSNVDATVRALIDRAILMRERRVSVQERDTEAEAAG